MGGKWFVDTITIGKKCPEKLLWKRSRLDMAGGGKGK